MRVYIVLITYMSIRCTPFKCKTKHEGTVKNKIPTEPQDFLNEIPL